MQREQSKTFGPSIQWFIALYGFLIAFPIIEIPGVGISISFPIFLLICFLVWAQGHLLFWIGDSGLDRLLTWFFLACAVSILFAVDVDSTKDGLFVKDCLSFLYLGYWFCVYLFFKKWFWFIDLKILSYAFFIGMCLSGALVLFGSVRGASYVAGLFSISQNAFAVNSVACIGIGMWALCRRFGGWGAVSASILFVLMALVSQSRSGAILIFLQCVILFASIILRSHVRIRRLVIALSIVLAFGLFLSPSGKNNLGEQLGGVLAPITPELALFVADPQGVIDNDKSWMIRQIQVEKGIELFRENPLTGVGYRHFRNVMADVDMRKYGRLQRDADRYTLSRSSHNTHIQVLAETGLMGFVPFILVNVFVCLEVIRQLLRQKVSMLTIFLGTSLLGVTAYFWVISAITGAMWYVALGLFAGSMTDPGRRGRGRSLVRKGLRQLSELEGV